MDVNRSLATIDDKGLSSLAMQLSQSSLFAKEKKEDLVAKLLIGRDMGLSISTSVMEIIMISGKAGFTAKLLTGKLKASGKYRYTINESTHEYCQATLYERFDTEWFKVADFEYTITEAKRAGLVGKDNWKKYPKDMLANRCLARMARLGAGDVFLGMGVYLPEELEPNEPEQIIHPKQPLLPFANKEQAIAWAMNVLDYDFESCQLIFNNVEPDSTGKKAYAFYYKILEIAEIIRDENTVEAEVIK